MRQETETYDLPRRGEVLSISESKFRTPGYARLEVREEDRRNVRTLFVRPGTLPPGTRVGTYLEFSFLEDGSVGNVRVVSGPRKDNKPFEPMFG